MSWEKPGHHPLTELELLTWQAVCRWHFAESMPQNPHWYTLRKNQDDGMFNRVIEHMREFGYDGYFQGAKYRYYNIGHHYYWTMGAPINDTILINRKPLDQREMLDR